MQPSVKNNGDREFNPAEQMFLCDLKLGGTKYPEITNLLMAKFNKDPPTRQGVNYITRKLKTEFTVLDRRKGRSGRRVTVRTARNIAAVKRSLQRASHRSPGQPGPSARKHTESISKSTYNKITWQDLRFKPYKILHLHKVTNMQTEIMKIIC